MKSSDRHTFRFATISKYFAYVFLLVVVFESGPQRGSHDEPHDGTSTVGRLDALRNRNALVGSIRSANRLYSSAQSLKHLIPGGTRPIGMVHYPMLQVGGPQGRKSVPVDPPHAWNAEQSRNLAKLHWASGKQVRARGRSQNGTVQYLKGWRLGEAAERAKPGYTLEETTALKLLENNKDLFMIDQPEAEWKVSSSGKDDLGLTQVHMRQIYKELEVWPATLTVQLDLQGNARLVTAAYAPTPRNLDVVPTLDQDDASHIALNYLRDEHLSFSHDAQVEEQRLLVYAPIEEDASLAYSIELHAGSGVDWLVMVEAHTGEVLASINQVCSAAAQGSGMDAGGQTQTIELWEEENVFTMVNTTKPMFDAQRSDPPFYQTTFGGISIFDAKGVNPQQDPQAFNPQPVTSTDAHSGFGPNAVSASVNLAKVYDYYQKQHQRNSIDGQGGSIIGIINVPIDNAYWQNDLITFGNLNNWAHTLDFAAHEMTHGVIEKTANLVYQNQPGAMNEAFADIFGESAEAFHEGGTPDWKLGSRLTRPLRDMRDPASVEIGNGRRYPIKMSEIIAPNDPYLDNFQGRDNGGVHLNSSIINFAYFQLAEGLPGAVGIPTAERIFYRALTTKLQKQSQFLDCRIACVQSAEEIFGAGSNEVTQTANAFDVVEIFEQAPAPEPTPLPTVSGEDSTLFTFVSPIDGATYLARREAGMGDPVSGTLLVQVPVAPGKRPVVSRDGTEALFVTSDFAMAYINTSDGEGEILTEPGTVWSVGASPDASMLGFVLMRDNQPEDIINIYDVTTDAWAEFDLKAPALDGGATDTILFADVVNFSPDNRVLYYDALNRITFSDGSQMDTWSIYALDMTAQSTISIVPPIPGASVGNPSMGRVHANHMVFEAEDLQTGRSHILTHDLTTGETHEVGVIFTSAGLAFPDYFGDDQSVLYSDYAFDGFFGFLTGSGLVRQPLASDGLAPEGAPTIWLEGSNAGATIGAMYRRGVYEGLNSVEVTLSQPTVGEGHATAVSFVLHRAGVIDQPLSVQFLLTGTASPGKDFVTIPLSASFAAGEDSARVAVQLIDDIQQEEEEKLTLTLTESRQYTLGARAQATLVIQDDDEAVLSGYGKWAAERGIGGPTLDDDGDQRPNLMEYALGTDPKAVTPGSPLLAEVTAIGGQSMLAVRIARNGKPTDVDFDFEISSDLMVWKSAGGAATVLEDTDSTLLIGIGTSLLDADRTFVRLVVRMR